MELDRHARLMALFDELCELSPPEQSVRLAAVRGEDERLADDVAAMLAADRDGGDALDRGPDVTRALQRTTRRKQREAEERRPILERVTHYRVMKKLGAGGMGEVYSAVDERLGRKVALKLLPAAAEWSVDSRMRMLREAQAASALNHPGIVTLYDLEANDGRLFLVMELVDGESFRALANRGVAPAEALRLVAEAADALAAAHAAGVLHRDIKGDNIMLARDGRVKVLDFGLAKILDEALHGDTAEAMWELASQPRLEAEAAAIPLDPPSPLQTGAGVVIGTPSYMAPEQTRGEVLTEKSEVFSLGIVLYELLTGVRPFARASVHETIAAVREGKPPPPSRRAPDRKIGEDIDRLVLRALAPLPEDRFPGMAAFAAAIRALGAPAPRRPRWPWIAAGGLALVGASGAALGLLGGDAGPVLSGAARRLTFDPGCEEFPSFTPDGKTLVFDAIVEGDYDLFALDLAGGTRRRLTRARGWDYSAAVSPDGARIAYTHQSRSNSVRVLPLSGEGEPILLGQADGYPAWTPRGTVVYAVQDRIVEWDPAGGAREIATVPDNRRAIYLAPFPDGSLYAVLGTPDQEVAPQIAVLEAGRVRAVPIADAAEYAIVASPDGRYLYHQRTAAAGGVELVRRPRDGGRAAVLEAGIAPTGGLAFAPGGGKLAFSTCKSTSFVGRIVGGRVQPLTRAGGWTDGYPTSLDARRLLFTSDRAGSSQVWQLDLSTGAAVPLTPPGTLRAAVAPDRSRLAWAALDPPGIFVAALDKDGQLGEARRATDRRGDTAPQFSHDGAHVLFVRIDDEGGERVWVAPAGGGEARALTPPHASIAAASPVDDEVVYLVSRGDAGTDVLVTDVAGHTSSLLVALPAGAFRSLRHSPDGRRLLVIHEDQEILEIDRRAGRPSVASLWHGGVESATAVDYAPDGDGVVASVVVWEGDLWIVDGRF